VANSKKKQVRAEETKVEAVEVVGNEEVVEAAEVQKESITKSLADIKKQLQAIEPGHREITIAVADSVALLNRLHSLATFIESTQADLAKKKK
jgi:hypothetical protein